MSGKFIDAYAVLEIPSDADDAAVRARHRELAKQFHPDRGGRAADGELMMRINRARDVLLDPVARATLDEELARRRRKAAASAAAGKAPSAASPATPPLSRDRRWRAEWGATTPRPAPPAGSSSPAPVPPPARVRPSASRLRQATRQARAANAALSSRQRTPAPKPPPTVTEPPAPQPAAPQPASPQPVSSQPAPPQQKTAPSADKPTNAWSLYSAPLDAVSVASLLTSVLMCGPLGFILGIIGLARTADDKRRGRWAAVAGIAISSLTMLVAIGYVMQAISAPSP
ncbi:DnaJ domain-containing protein [Nocardioides sp. YR527]|uniref:DnaJ domain-containing protein n=1 Tax=Nocardioides sp. YR527 TaxID=1881028 RepID=UPI000A6082C5|nr:DnaJ domain-containing protein [Nocardioides sp. YR527]